MTILSIILLVTAAALILIGRILKKRQVEASWQLAQKMKASGSENSEKEDTCSDWDAQWDDAEEKMDQDFFMLLSKTSGVFKAGAILLAAGAILLLFIK